MNRNVTRHWDRFLDGLIRNRRRLRHPTTENHESPRRNETVWNLLWGDLSTYNAEISRGIAHGENYVELMRRKQELFNETNTAAYREAGYTPLHNGDGTIIGWTGYGKPRMLHWDEARIRMLFPDWAHVAFDYTYDPATDIVSYVVRSELLTADL